MDGLRRSIALLVVLALGMAALPEVAAVRYTVGGNMGWITNVNYTVWAQGNQFYNGDWLSQFTGATLSGFTLHVLLHPIKHVGTTSPSGSDLQALIMEIVVTFSMMFVTSAVAIDTKAVGELAGIAVGSAVCITSVLAGPISGGSMNPARTLGPAIASGYYKGFWVYIVGPVCGTFIGGMVIQLHPRFGQAGS